MYSRLCFDDFINIFSDRLNEKDNKDYFLKNLPYEKAEKDNASIKNKIYRDMEDIVNGESFLWDELNDFGESLIDEKKIEKSFYEKGNWGIIINV